MTPTLLLQLCLFEDIIYSWNVEDLVRLHKARKED